MTGVPEIVVAEAGSPQLRTWDITRAHAQGHGPRDSMGTMYPDSPSPTGHTFTIPNPDLTHSHPSAPATDTNPPDHVRSNPFIDGGAGAQSNPYGTYGQRNNSYGMTGDPWASIGGVTPASPKSPVIRSDPASPGALSRNPYRTSDLSMLSRGSGSPRGHS
jgi:hypothetical protein